MCLGSKAPADRALRCTNESRLPCARCRPVWVCVPAQAEHERVVAPVAVRIDDASPANLLDGESKHILCLGGGKHPRRLVPPAPECRKQGLCRRHPSRFPFRFPPKYDSSTSTSPKGRVAIDGMSQDDGTGRGDGFIRRIVGEAELLSNLPDGEFQFEEFDETQPLSGGKFPWLIQRPEKSWKVYRHGNNGVYHPPVGRVFFALTAVAKSLMVFKSKIQQYFRAHFGFYQTL